MDNQKRLTSTGWPDISHSIRHIKKVYMVDPILSRFKIRVGRLDQHWPNFVGRSKTEQPLVF